MQYTIRGVPPELDRALRARAKAAGQSLNEAAIEALSDGVGLGEDDRRWHDFSDLAGTWQEDPEFDAAIAARHVIDEEMWR